MKHLYYTRPLKLLVTTACAFSIGFALSYAAQAEIINYSTTFSVIHQQNPRAVVSPGQVGIGDQYEIRFSLDTSALATALGTFSGLATSFSLTALPGNTGSFPLEGLTLSASTANFYPGSPNGSFALLFSFSDGPEINFDWTDMMEPTSTPTVGRFESFQFYFTYTGIPTPDAGTPFDDVAQILLNGTPNSGNSYFNFKSSTIPGASAYYNGSFQPMVVEPIPEPGTFALLGMAGAALLLLRKRRQ